MRSKQLLASIVALCALTCLGYGQMVLNTGESFTYEFVNLPFSETVGVSGNTPGCGLSVFYEAGDFLFEMFEDSTSETPFVSSGSIGPPGFWYGSPYHWQDFQGVVRFTALSDSVVIDRFQVDAYVPRGYVSDVYSITVVPEPSTLTLSALGFALFYGVLSARHSKSKASVPPRRQTSGCREPGDEAPAYNRESVAPGL